MTRIEDNDLHKISVWDGDQASITYWFYPSTLRPKYTIWFTPYTICNLRNSEAGNVASFLDILRGPLLPQSPWPSRLKCSGIPYAPRSIQACSLQPQGDTPIATVSTMGSRLILQATSQPMGMAESLNCTPWGLCRSSEGVSNCYPVWSRKEWIRGMLVAAAIYVANGIKKDLHTKRGLVVRKWGKSDPPSP